MNYVVRTTQFCETIENRKQLLFEVNFITILLQMEILVFHKCFEENLTCKCFFKVLEGSSQKYAGFLKLINVYILHLLFTVSVVLFTSVSNFKRDFEGFKDYPKWLTIP